MAFTIAGLPEFADPSQRPSAGFDMVTPDFFKTYSIPVLRGRAFSDQDTAASVRVAMVNKRFADQYLTGKDPLQQHILVDELIPGVTKFGAPISWQIVGVFNNVRAGGFRNDFPQIVVPFAQTPWPTANIGVHTAGDPAALFHSIAVAVHSVDPQIALAEPRTLEEIKSRNLGGDRFIMTLLGAFACVALILAAVGIYGVVAFTVAQREHEIGLRMALGASRGSVVSLVLKEAMTLASLGLGLGLIGAYLVGRTMHSAFYGIALIDFSAIFAVAIVLLGAALLASYIPARRASSIEPMQALRAE
jgi:putative ABC transport system permease protein